MNQEFRGRHSPAHLTALAASFTAKPPTNSVTSPSDSQVWLSNSGCNGHLTSELANLTVSTEYNGEAQVAVGNSQPLPISHSGCATLSTGCSSFLLSNLLRVPHISANLLSVHQFCVDNNFIFIFYANSFTIQDKTSGRTLFHGPSVNGLYPLTSLPPALSCSSNKSSFATLSYFSFVWHDRLGHPNSAVLNSVLKLLYISPTAVNSSLCTHCLNGKMHKLPCTLSRTSTCFSLEIVHSYVWGPSPEVSINAYRYYVSFIDDLSRYTWIFPLAQKSDVSSVIKRFKPFVENLLSSKLKIFRSDGGGEYVNHDLSYLF